MSPLRARCLTLLLLAAVDAACVTSGWRPAAEPPASEAALQGGAFLNCREESFTRRDGTIVGVRCPSVRVVGDVNLTNRDASELAAEQAQRLKDTGATVSVQPRSLDGDPLIEVRADFGPAKTPTSGEIWTFQQRQPGTVYRMLCDAESGSPRTEACRGLFSAIHHLKQRLPSVRDVDGSWSTHLEGQRVRLSGDCYWRGPSNLFCREGEMSWTPAADLNRAEAISKRDRERPLPLPTSVVHRLDAATPVPCRVFGQPTQCMSVHFEFKRDLVRRQVVDAWYTAIPARDHAVSIICSVDRGSVPTGLGALCGQLFELERR